MVLSNDLDHILEYTDLLWRDLRQQRLFITGGTGFFGCWLLESFLWANKKFDLQAQAVILTRDKNRFAKKYPYLFAQPALHFHEGDITSYTFPPGHFSHIIHAAGDTTIPLLQIESQLAGTKRTLEFALSCGAKNFLLTSSGAVYGSQKTSISHLKEDEPFIEDTSGVKSIYTNSKREMEELCRHYAQQSRLDIKIARCFAFVGPYLSLDSHFAIANFIRDGLHGLPIVVNGDGTTYRSYLYAADLMIWLWTILFRGKTAYPYNVGSDIPISIADTAQLVAESFSPKLNVKIMQPPTVGILPERYVPDTQRARDELGLVQRINLSQAIQATKNWHINSSSLSSFHTDGT